MKEKILDNPSCQEIKEMIEKNEIDLNELDSDTLSQLMNYEIDMICFGEGDVDLIKQCTDILNTRDKTMMPKNEFMDIIEGTKKEHVIIIDKKRNNRNAHIILKRAALVAVIASVLLCSSCCVLELIPDICQYIASIVRQPEGAVSHVDGFTFYHNGEAKKYSTIEEMVDSEDLDIMYPTKWPDGIEVEDVILSSMANGNDTIYICTNKTDVSVQIEFNADPINTESTDIFKYNNIDYFIKHDEYFMAMCHHNNNKYYISTNSREDLVLIIENFKE